MSARCARCRVELEEQEVTFCYLENTFTATAPVCPSCGQVYIPEDLAQGRIREVEEMLEDK